MEKFGGVGGTLLPTKPGQVPPPSPPWDIPNFFHTIKNYDYKLRQIYNHY